MRYRSHVAFLVALILLFASRAFATETAQSLAMKLQQQLLGSTAVSLSFTTKGEGHVKIVADPKANRVRIESASTLIISDGKVVWNYDKKLDRVTIDNIGPNSSYREALSLFRFADNYSATLGKSGGKDRYTLVLTPTAKLQSLLKAASNMQQLTLDVKRSGKLWKIVSARASSSQGETATERLRIESLRTAPASDFTFTPKLKTKVIDLRD